MCPAHLTCDLCERGKTLGMLARSRASVSGKHTRWKWRFSGVSAVDSPDLTIEESGENHCVVDLQLRHQTDSPLLPTSSRSLLKTELALKILLLTSASMFIAHYHHLHHYPPLPPPPPPPHHHHQHHHYHHRYHQTEISRSHECLYRRLPVKYCT